MPQPEPRPWAPFKSLADFEYTETAILGLLPKWIVNKQLTGLNSNWAEASRITIKNFTEMDKVLSKARKCFVQVNRDQLPSPSLIRCSQFKSDVVTANFQGKAYKFPFEYRDPWQWTLSIIQDESLAPIAMWNAVQKYHCSGDFEERIYNEPNTADTWWHVDVSRISTNSCFTFFEKISPSPSFLIMIFFPTLIFHSISGSTRAWLHDMWRNIPCYCDPHGFHARYGMPLGTEEVFWLDICPL